MLALAIVLLVIVGLLVVVSFVGNSEELVITFLNVEITTSVGGVFVTGVVCGLVALASALALRRSWRQHQARAEEVRELRRLAGIPDPADTESATAGSGAASPSTTPPGDPGKPEGDGDENGDADTARAGATAPSEHTNDTAPLPDSEEPPRT